MLLICLITVLVCLALEVNTYAWVSKANVVHGQVIEIVQRPGRKGKSYAPKITYELDDEVHEFAPVLGSSDYSEYKLGESVKIVVSKGRESFYFPLDAAVRNSYFSYTGCTYNYIRYFDYSERRYDFTYPTSQPELVTDSI